MNVEKKESLAKKLSDTINEERYVINSSILIRILRMEIIRLKLL